MWEYGFGEDGGNLSAIVADGKACISFQEYWHCFDEKTGKIVLKEKLFGPPILVSGVLIAPNTSITESSNEQTSVITAYFEEGVKEETVEVSKNIVQKIWEIIINFFKKIF